jgi:hypothetical protein
VSMYGNMVAETIAALPKTKGDGENTFRSLIYNRIADAAYDAIGGSPWQLEAVVAIHHLYLAVDAAIDSDPVLREIFDAVRHPPQLPPFPPASGLPPFPTPHGA